MSADQEKQREFLRTALAATGLDATNLARRAKLAPSTINRFLNQPVGHLLSGKTLAAVARASGIPVPADVSSSVAPVTVPPIAKDEVDGGRAERALEAREHLPAPSDDVLAVAIKTARSVARELGVYDPDPKTEARVVRAIYKALTGNNLP